MNLSAKDHLPLPDVGAGGRLRGTRLTLVGIRPDWSRAGIIGSDIGPCLVCSGGARPRTRG